MKIANVKQITTNKPVAVTDTFVGDGYLQGVSGSLPDVDIDFQSDRRQEIKEYWERRYNHGGKERVFSAGTLTTLKAKAAIKDVARTMRIPPSIVNYFTAILQDGDMSYTDIFKLASENKKVAKFIHKYPTLFEDIRELMNQPRSSSIHASAVIITPDKKDGEEAECFDFIPIKKVDGNLISENDGYELDELGLLKNDCLATKELSKMHQVVEIVNREYGQNLSLREIAESSLDVQEVYELFQKGFTQDIFQFSSHGMTKFLVELQPNCIDDLIAANALYRPATIGSLDDFINRKRGLIAPTYLWGTYEALKSTFGVVVYQEQIIRLAREVGGFSLGDGVKLVKFISKKKIPKIREMKEKFMKGAEERGCPKEDMERIWEQVESAGAYCFNKSHAAAYSVNAYIGAYLKALYPTAFYTVVLDWADDKELATLMSEMVQCSKAKIVPPDINYSQEKFYTDYENDKIFWSLSRIKMLGTKAVDWILEERNKNGKFTSISNFIDRVFKYKLKNYRYWDDPDNDEEAIRCPVNARHVQNLIVSGCFDIVEDAHSPLERYAILDKAAKCLGFRLNEKDYPEDMIAKEYFWEQQQVKISGIGAVDYRRIYNNSGIVSQIKNRGKYSTFEDIEPMEMEGKRVNVCATIASIDEINFQSKKTGEMNTFCKMVLIQNSTSCECVIWGSEYSIAKERLQNCVGKIIVFSAIVKYNDYLGKNSLQFTRGSKFEII